MKKLFHEHSRQEIVETFLNHEFNLSKNKKSDKIIYILDLLKYNDEEFITELYRNLLEREPDTGGYHHYLRLLKTDKIIKETLLYSFINSPEAQKLDAEVKGLKFLICLNFLFKVAIFKKIYYFLVYHR